MALNLSNIVQNALNVVFNLGLDIVKDATFFRPVGLNPRTGAVAPAEIRATVKSIFVRPRSVEVRSGEYQQTDEKALIRASELTAIVSPGPAPGDYILATVTNQRYDILAGQLDSTGKLYTFKISASLHEDCGDLTAHGASEDWGDLTAATDFDDRGALFGAIV